MIGSLTDSSSGSSDHSCWTSLYASAEKPLKLKFLYDRNFVGGVVFSKELADAMDILVEDETKSLYFLEEPIIINFSCTNENSPTIYSEVEVKTLGIDHSQSGMKLSVPFHHHLLDFGGGVHVLGMPEKDFSEFPVSNYDAVRERQNAFRKFFKKILKHPESIQNILHLSDLRPMFHRLRSDDASNLAHDLLNHVNNIRSNDAKILLVVVVYLLAREPCKLTYRGFGMDSDTVVNAIQLCIELREFSSALIILEDTELFSNLDMNRLNHLELCLRHYLNESVTFNNFFFENFKYTRETLLLNIGSILESPENLVTQDDFAIIGDLMSVYAESCKLSDCSYKFQPEDQGLLRDHIFVILPDLAFTSCSYDARRKWSGPFLLFMQNLIVHWPFVLEHTRGTLFELQFDHNDPRLRELIIHFMPLYSSFKYSPKHPPRLRFLRDLESNIKIFANATPGKVYEAIEFHLYLSGFMKLHAEPKTQFYREITELVVNLFGNKAGKILWAKRPQYIEFMSQFGLHRLLHLYTDDMGFISKLKKTKTEIGVVKMLYSTLKFNLHCFIVLLNNLRPSKAVISALRSYPKFVQNFSVESMILDTYESFMVGVETEDQIKFNWDVPDSLLASYELFPKSDRRMEFDCYAMQLYRERVASTKVLCLQLLLLKHFNIMLDSTFTSDHDDQIPSSEYEMILNFFLERHCAIHQKQKKLHIKIPKLKWTT